MPKPFRLNMLVNARSTKLLASFAMAFFVALGCLMAFMFARYGVMPLSILSMGSAAIYLVCTAILYKEYWRTFAFIINATVFTYVSLVVYYVGWESDFQLAIPALCILNYYAEYAARTMRVKTLHAANLSACGMIVYLGLLAYSHRHAAPYALPSEVLFRLQMLWGFILFALTISYLQIFILIARNAEDTLLDRADHDVLTGLPNRAFMSDYLKDLARSTGLSGYWVAMADIDDFKRINDTYGHNCGDMVLKTLAELLAGNEDEYEVCRWGGEEFLLVGSLDGVPDPDQALERLRETIAGYRFWYKDVRLNITVTMGVAHYEDGQSILEWVNAADTKLYEGKMRGKNRVVA